MKTLFKKIVMLLRFNNKQVIHGKMKRTNTNSQAAVDEIVNGLLIVLD